MIREKHQFVVERTVCVCDRCGREMTREDTPDEWQEKFAVRFRGGYGSVFGDGSAVEGDFCQHCIQQVLGKYLRVRVDDPFNPDCDVTGSPERILQPNQQEREEQLEQLSRLYREDTFGTLARNLSDAGDAPA